MNIVYPHVNGAMKALCGSILRYGEVSAPRGKPIKEIIGHSVSFDMRRPLCTLPTRNLGYRFAPAEAAWILSGDNRVSTIRRYSSFVWEFSDDDVFYSGAYGPKVVDQLTYVCDCLAGDPDSRQAVIDIWRPNPRTSRDIPCTLSYQFLVRSGQIHVVQTMRSGDAWLGYPYDAFNASMLAGYVLLLLRKRAQGDRRAGLKGIELGTHTMNIGSAHVYEKEWDLAEKLIVDGGELLGYAPFDPLSMFDEPSSLIDQLWLVAAQDWDSMSNRDWLFDLKDMPSGRRT